MIFESPIPQEDGTNLIGISWKISNNKKEANELIIVGVHKTKALKFAKKCGVEIKLL